MGRARSSIIFIIVFAMLFSLYPAKDITLSESHAFDLLYGEFRVRITALHDIDSFTIFYSIPQIYGDQIPILIRIRNDTSLPLKRYFIVSQENMEPNKLLCFKVGKMEAFEERILHFDFWVLAINRSFNLPDYIKIPSDNELPENTKLWLSSTKAIQANNSLISWKAKQLTPPDENLITLANNIVNYTSQHRTRGFIRIILTLLSPNRFSGWAKYMDAASTLLLGGSCTGRANLGAALFRANGVPARVLLVLLTWPWMNASGLWYDMHYICEYYCPGYGWIPAETSLSLTPVRMKNNIVIRIVYPKDENEAGNKWDKYGGCEQWFWTDTEKVRIWWKNIAAGVRSEMKKELITNEDPNYIMNITLRAYEFYIAYTGMELTEEDRIHYEEAIEYQEKAIKEFLKSNLKEYVENMEAALEEYEKI